MYSPVRALKENGVESSEKKPFPYLFMRHPLLNFLKLKVLFLARGESHLEGKNHSKTSDMFSRSVHYSAENIRYDSIL